AACLEECIEHAGKPTIGIAALGDVEPAIRAAADDGQRLTARRYPSSVHLASLGVLGAADETEGQGNGGARDEAQEFAACHVPAAQTVSTNPKEDSGEHDVSQPPAPLRGPEAATPQLSVSAMRLEVLVSG